MHIAPDETQTPHRVVIHAEQCKGCGRCVISCPNGVLEMTDIVNKQGLPTARAVVAEKCRACGICYYSCPEPGGITIDRRVKPWKDPESEPREP